MMMGEKLLSVMGILLKDLTHQNFLQAESLIEKNADAYFAAALKQVEAVIGDIFAKQPRTLQKLSATFRRGDLVEALTGHPVSVQV
jgi:hypothetical protein